MSLSCYLIFGVLLFLVFKYVGVFINFYKDKKTLSCIPGPKLSCLLENLPIIMSDSDAIFDLFRELSSKYYPIFRISAVYATIINLLHPDDIEQVLSSTKHLSKSRIYVFLEEWLGTGLLTSTGAKWHHRRKILTPAFHFTILQEFIVIFNDETEKLVKKLSTTREAIDIIPSITQFTLQSIGETAMGFSNVEESVLIKYRAAVHKIGQILLQRLSKPWLRFNLIYRFSKISQEQRKLVQILHDFSNGIIAQRMKNRKEKSDKKRRPAMLDLLLEAQEEGVEIDDEGIREEVDTFMFEGHDTTAMAISMILLTLANHQDHQKKIFEEVVKILGPTRNPTISDLQQLKYTERCIKECLRLFPSVPFMSRYASEEFCTKTGYTIPKGTILHLHIFDIHRNPNLYPDPLKFDPDRFLPEATAERHPFAYIPFSAGPRNCIGQKFALLELKTVLCGILRRFILEKVDDVNNIRFKADLVLRPKNKVQIKFVPRSL